MNIPGYQTLMLPLLKFAGDKTEHSIHEATDYIADYYKLTDKQRKEILPSGQQYIIYNRVGWARTYLKKAGLLESTKKSFLKITSLGLDVLKKNPTEINVKFLEQFPSFNEFKNIKKDKTGQTEIEEVITTQQTPHELIELGYQKINKDLSQELLINVKQMTPHFFEKLVLKLLLSMGYGGSIEDAGEAIGQTGDGGIDGIIKEDRLGLDVIYIQAKRWENNVGSNELRNFVGSLEEKKAKKGVFLTTSGFTKSAIDYVRSISHKVILIDGELLTQLMIDFSVGVAKVISYDIKKVDQDFFIEE